MSQVQLNIIQTEDDLINSPFLPCYGEEDSSTSLNSTFIYGDPDLFCNFRERRKVNTTDFNHM